MLEGPKCGWLSPLFESSAEKGLFLIMSAIRNVTKQSFSHSAPKISAATFFLLHHISCEKSFKVFPRYIGKNVKE